MKFVTIIICCLALIACEDDADDVTLSDDVLGGWSITNMGQFANADCSGDLDYTGWALAVAFGVSMEYSFNADGTVDVSTTAFGMTETETLSWDVDGDQLCIEGECETVDLSGDAITIVTSADAYCEDDMGDEIDGVTMTECEAAGNDWYEAACYEFTATRQ
ncbi:MAG: hypothetical protein HOB84_12490 [Candidatus Marinimicrobia bacterium]|jgi:hypothetical protein|nr:hypothetical protein [Candidatus Neomarinimicrobiota bacterium]MBT4361027.1 hypothetical protein [Candidatus Neomarinimicrobiota bacterium]MBT4715581.1 hypothetical protein [Candidatus Neomarinimicrobiota bacterium]MBT4946780.1 hypothetical protein [Candidatus Neomarinimicrobiota bacterium]MBT5269271.1 hypothetical protein [Candidatus Neomarinimicrobiota bacterium]